RVALLLAKVRSAASKTITQRTLFGRPLAVVLVVGRKAAWGTVLLGLSGVLLALRVSQSTDPFQILFRVELSEDPHDLIANFLIGLLPSVSLGAELLVALAALTWALVETLQVWGLWRMSGRSKVAS
ncbi:MAG TPA: DUF2127 domain-containing protein, partial [Chloroflexota bacterium]|nr:DUF2127 domain-containing protein [Chloroflexota bacterium]